MSDLHWYRNMKYGLSFHDSRLTFDSKIAKSFKGVYEHHYSKLGDSQWRTRVPFKSLIDYLEHGKTLSEFLEDFPSASRSDAIAALEEARITLVAALE